MEVHCKVLQFTLGISGCVLVVERSGHSRNAKDATGNPANRKKRESLWRWWVLKC